MSSSVGCHRDWPRKPQAEFGDASLQIALSLLISAATVTPFTRMDTFVLGLSRKFVPTSNTSSSLLRSQMNTLCLARHCTARDPWGMRGMLSYELWSSKHFI
eukprot:m.96703 g.96703  ORF g.96703 m.96703 type:complete len:102 (-) comp12372_c0_seq1:2373-2678(-)